jgi:HAD superfamily hydrolase (TIGR01490 family)
VGDLERLIEDVESGPQGAAVGAFFDFDGTLISGYSARAWYGERLRNLDVGPAELARTLLAGVEMSVNDADVTRFMRIAVKAWAGRTADELEELGERLFVQHIAGMVYPQSDPLVRAHRRAGHTIAIASSATPFQVAPLARELGIPNLLCTEVEVVNGVATGELGGPVLWGEGKANAVRAFAEADGVDLRRSFAYGNGKEDLRYLEAVGRPRPLNPDGGLTKLARDRRWETFRFPDRGRPGPLTIARTGAAIAGLTGAVAAGVGLGLLTRSRRAGANLAIGAGSDAALALAGVTLNIRGEEHLWSERPAVFIFNHQSSLDMLIVASLVRRDLTGVAKKEAARDPRFAPVGLITDVAYIDRKDSSKARSALEPVVEKLRNGSSLVIAPEGTRTPTARLGRFKKGAFHIAMQAAVPVVPIVVRNAGELMWRGSNVVRSGTVDVAVLPPINTDGWRPQDLNRRIAAIRDAYASTFEELAEPVAPKEPREVAHA